MNRQQIQLSILKVSSKRKNVNAVRKNFLLKHLLNSIVLTSVRRMELLKHIT